MVIKLKSGRDLDVSQGVIGIAWFAPGHTEERLYDGFDGQTFSHYADWMSGDEYYENECLTDEEKREVAQHMIERWKEWAGIEE